MRKVLKDFFIPCEDNNYCPHVLHTKRTALCGVVFLGMKVIIFGVTLLLPMQVFMLPDVLAHEQARISAFTNDLRVQKGLPVLSEVPLLDRSAHLRTSDMASGQYFAHFSPEGRTFSYFLGQAGYEYQTAGENLAMGFSSAEDVFTAWTKSPIHYANLIDPEFSESGISLESGLYDGLATVYVAQHFGTPQQESGVLMAAFAEIQEEKKETVSLVGEESFVSWEDRGESTAFTAQARVQGAVRSAIVFINGYSMELQPTDVSGIYRGTLIAPEPINQFFTPVIMPAIQLVGEDGGVVNEVIRWERVKIVAPTPIEKYIKAQQMLPVMRNVFDISRGVYIGFAVFFAFALVLNIFVEIRRQHRHIVLQTLGLILLLTSLAIV